MAKRILVVDDDLDTCDLLRLYLTEAGFDVCVAADGNEVLLMAGSFKPDLIFTDISMPDMDGIELIKRLRASPELSTLPIIAFTAHDRDVGDEALSAGASRVLHKPMRYKFIVEEIKKLAGITLTANLYWM